MFRLPHGLWHLVYPCIPSNQCGLLGRGEMYFLFSVWVSISVLPLPLYFTCQKRTSCPFFLPFLKFLFPSGFFLLFCTSTSVLQCNPILSLSQYFLQFDISVCCRPVVSIGLLGIHDFKVCVCMSCHIAHCHFLNILHFLLSCVSTPCCRLVLCAHSDSTYQHSGKKKKSRAFLESISNKY